MAFVVIIYNPARPNEPPEVNGPFTSAKVAEVFLDDQLHNSDPSFSGEVAEVVDPSTGKPVSEMTNLETMEALITNLQSAVHWMKWDEAHK